MDSERPAKDPVIQIKALLFHIDLIDLCCYELKEILTKLQVCIEAKSITQAEIDQYLDTVTQAYCSLRTMRGEDEIQRLQRIFDQLNEKHCEIGQLWIKVKKEQKYGL